ncbi:MAG: V-type ATPase 116kDa subunit family protein [Pseudoflavonifractor sp.]
MKRLRAIGMGTERDALLEALQHLGCVQVDEPADKRSDPAWAGLVRVDDTHLGQAKADAAALKAALVTLNKYDKPKGGLFAPRPEITERQLFDAQVTAAAMAAVAAINTQEKQLAALQSEESKIKTQKTALSPWLDLEVPLDLASTKEVSYTFGAVSAKIPFADVVAELAALTELCLLSPAGRDREFQYVLVVCHKTAEEAAFELLKRSGFTRSALRGWTGTARENTDKLDARLAALSLQRDAAAAAIAAEGVHRGELKQTIDRMTQDLWREEVKGRLLKSQTAIFFEGWVPVPELPHLEDLLGSYTCAWETEDPLVEDYPQVPIKLKSNILTNPLNMVTEMYSLPAYDGVDPNPLIMPFFVFFFGFMFADLGYGIILMLVSLFIQKKMKPKGTMGYMMGLMFECGVASALIGFFTGGFFSDAIKTVCTMMDWAVPNIPFLTNGPLLDVTNDPLTVLIFCMAVGVVQLITGMAVNAYMLIRDGHWFDALCDVGTWWLVFAGIAVFAITGNWYVIAAGGVAIVLTQGRNGKGIFGKFSGILGSLYNNITGYFGDVLSYSRLMVMMLAGSVIGSIFNLLGSMPGNIFVFAVVFVVGHIFNMGLNVIGTYVHASRLQYLEFFGKFYKEGGKPFQPLNLNTKYVDIIKEEN